RTVVLVLVLVLVLVPPCARVVVASRGLSPALDALGQRGPNGQSTQDVQREVPGSNGGKDGRAEPDDWSAVGGRHRRAAADAVALAPRSDYVATKDDEARGRRGPDAGGCRTNQPGRAHRRGKILLGTRGGERTRVRAWRMAAAQGHPCRGARAVANGCDVGPQWESRAARGTTQRQGCRRSSHSPARTRARAQRQGTRRSRRSARAQKKSPGDLGGRGRRH